MNPNLQSATLLVHALARSGLTDVVICPGSRSTPLTLAFDAAEGINVHLSLDERSGAFLALGIALATDRPTAIVCTSGTAAANFYPAIIEANMSQAPLLVLTADRPHELRHSGANQTIDQTKMFGDHVLWAVDMALPDQSNPSGAWRNIVTTASRAYAVANGQRKGPIHLNCPFRKPLESKNLNWYPEILSWADRFLNTTPNHQGGTMIPTRAQLERLVQWLNEFERGIIVCGPRCPRGEFIEALKSLSRRTGYPIFADPLSGLRYGDHDDALIVSAYEGALVADSDPDWAAPDMVIRFGQVPTSKWLNRWLDRISPDIRLHVRENGVWADDSHQTTEFWQVNEAALCQMAQSMISRGAFGGPNSSWLKKVQTWEENYWHRLDQSLAEITFDVSYLYQLIRHLGQNALKTNLVIGNSLPVRHLDQFCRASNAPIQVFGNRGASGIDGVISTACGIAKADPAQQTILVIGDVSFYHDMNGLLAARNLPNLTIVLMNNDSGSIFRRLPVATHEPAFTDLFLTAHHLNFEHTAALYQLTHQRVAALGPFLSALQSALNGSQPAVIEVMTDGVADEEARKEIIEKVIQR